MAKYKGIAVFGSRTLEGKKVEKLFDKIVNKYRPEYIVTSGRTHGVCEKARRYCRDKAIPLK